MHQRRAVHDAARSLDSPLAARLDSVPIVEDARMDELADIESYMQECRRLTLDEIKRLVPRDRPHTAGLYELMLDYPLRPAKALRPSLCIGVCLGLGGNLDAALPSAAALELIHNAFLIHDDVEDGSLRRRHGPTLHTTHGTSTAINVGDGMFPRALRIMLDNVRVLGVGPALRLFDVVQRMVEESTEGQNLELDWINRRHWDLRDGDYVRMVHKKTGWYSFIAPVQCGAIAAGANRATVDAFGRFALTLGIAFQIQDDLLSLESGEVAIGKDTLGDLWEGKYTLALLHALRSMRPNEREEALEILRLPRPVFTSDEKNAREDLDDRGRLFEKVVSVGVLTESERSTLHAALLGPNGRTRTAKHVERLYELVVGRGRESLVYARNIAQRWASRSLNVLDRQLNDVPESIHKQFLRSMVRFVIRRSR
jgi:geranylgeranyl diphosphate synthase, type II